MQSSFSLKMEDGFELDLVEALVEPRAALDLTASPHSSVDSNASVTEL